MAQRSKQSKKTKPKETKKSRKRNLVQDKMKKTKKKIPRTQKAPESGQKSTLKELDASRRQKWVPLNKNQTEFMSNTLDAAVSHAMSVVDCESAVKFEQQNSFLNATKTILLQSVCKIKVPPMKGSVSKSKPISRARFIEISENMDSSIQSLTEAIHKEKDLLAEREKLLKMK